MSLNYVMDWSNQELKPSFSIPVASVNNSVTSLTLLGRDTAGWDEKFHENLMHILEHWASPIAPPNPTWGQLWYDTAPGNQHLMIWTTLNQWIPIWQDAAAPTTPPVTTAFIAAVTTSVLVPLSLIEGIYSSAQILVTANAVISSIDVTGGALPAGLILAAGPGASSVGIGYVSGAPIAPGSYTGTIRISHNDITKVPSFLDRSFYINVSTIGTTFTLSPLTTPSTPTILIQGNTYTTISSESFVGSSNIILQSVTQTAMPIGMSLVISGSSVRLVGTPSSLGTYAGTVIVSHIQPGFTPTSTNLTVYASVTSAAPGPTPPPPPPPSDNGVPTDGTIGGDQPDSVGVDASDAGDAAGGDSGAGSAGGDSGGGGSDGQ